MTGVRKFAALHVLMGLSFGLFGCEEEKPVAPPVEEKKQEEVAAEAVEESPPHLVISEEGPTVRGASIEGGKKSGTLADPKLHELKSYLEKERKFIEGKELMLVVDRKAKRGWVSAYIDALGELGASKIIVATETREEFAGKLEFIPSSRGESLAGCTMIGQVTEHNGSALWKLEGGTAGERGPGLGGPDLSMAKEVIQKNYEKCESAVFVTDGALVKDWGFIYDMAAAAASIKESGIERALLPSEPQTAGRKVRF